MATIEIKESTAALLSRTRTDETRALEVAKARLSKEISVLRVELAAVRREVRRASPEAVRATSPTKLQNIMERAVREAVVLSSARLDAQIDGLEARLLPEPRLRPPFASDKEGTAAQGPRPKSKTPAPEPAVTTLSPPANPGRQEKKKKGTRVTAATKEAAAARRDGPSKVSGAAEVPPSKEWTKVSRKKKDGDKKRKKGAPPPPKNVFLNNNTSGLLHR